MDSTMHHTIPKRLLIMKKKTNEDDKIKITGIRLEISRNVLPIGRQIEFPQAQQFIERKPKIDWNHRPASSSTNDYHGKQYTQYYQPKHSHYNQHKHYCHDRATQ